MGPGLRVGPGVPLAVVIPDLLVQLALADSETLRVLKYFSFYSDCQWPGQLQVELELEFWRFRVVVLVLL